MYRTHCRTLKLNDLHIQRTLTKMSKFDGPITRYLCHTRVASSHQHSVIATVIIMSMPIDNAAVKL